MRLSLWFAILAMLVLSAARRQVADLDMYHQMALIREALSLGAIPRQDVFAFTPTVDPSVHHEWGAGALLYAVAIATGWGGAGILVLRYLLFAGIAALAYLGARRRGATDAGMAVCAPVAILMFGPGLATLRAHMYTFLFVALLLYFFQRDREGDRRWIAAWLVVYVLWLNLHGGFVAGVGLFTAYLAERLWDAYRAHGALGRAAFRDVGHLLATFAAMVPLVLVNPYGADYVPFLWESILMDRPLIDEWAPLWSHRAFPSLRLGFLVSLLFVTYAVAKGSAQVRSLLVVLVAAVAAIGAQRLVLLYAVVWFVTVPALVATSEIETVLTRAVAGRARVLVANVAVLIGLGLLYRTMEERPWVLTVPAFPGESAIYYPVGAVDYLAANDFSGNLMTDFGAGSYVSWHLHPDVRVGLDSRYEAAYPAGLPEEVFDFYAGRPGWETVLDRYPVDAVLVRTVANLRRELDGVRGANEESHGSAPRLIRVYRDDGYSIFATPEAAAELPVVDRAGEHIEGRFP